MVVLREILLLSRVHLFLSIPFKLDFFLEILQIENRK